MSQPHIQEHWVVYSSEHAKDQHGDFFIIFRFCTDAINTNINNKQ